VRAGNRGAARRADLHETRRHRCCTLPPAHTYMYEIHTCTRIYYLCICTYTYMYVCMYVCMYVHIALSFVS
jgi:hypothetical protein